MTPKLKRSHSDLRHHVAAVFVEQPLTALARKKVIPPAIIPASRSRPNGVSLAF